MAYNQNPKCFSVSDSTLTDTDLLQANENSNTNTVFADIPASLVVYTEVVTRGSTQDWPKKIKDAEL